MSGMSPHYFYEKDPVVTVRRISDFVNRINSSIESRVKTNGKISTIPLVVDRTGHAHHWKSKLLCKNPRRRISSVASNHDTSIDIMGFQGFVCFFSPFRGKKLLAPGGFQDRSSPVNNIFDRVSVISLDDSLDLIILSIVYAIHILPLLCF